jgi:dolichyl-phosphate-mannose-protein mannosyltransferase
VNGYSSRQNLISVKFLNEEREGFRSRMFTRANVRITFPLLILILGLISRSAFIWHPNEVVFDEVHFGKFVNFYLTGKYFFDIHPPLGKLIIALAAYISGLHPTIKFANIGEVYPDYSFIILRLFPNLFGALIPLCIYFFVLSLGGSVLAALFSGLTLVFENAIITQSHFISLDSMLIFFGFTGLTLFFVYRRSTSRSIYLFLAGILLGCSISVKWTGLSFLALAGVVSLWDVGTMWVEGKTITGEIARRLIYIVLVAFFVYFSTFVVHFSLLKKSGPGNAFMSPNFVKTLSGPASRNDDTVPPLGLIRKFVELNIRMYTANVSLTATHPYSSKFYTWPLMIRPVFFWTEENSPDTRSRIFLIGNPLIWWVAFLSLIASVFFWESKPPETKLFLYAGWYLALFPFVTVKRVLFLYHYLPGLIFSVVIMSLFIIDGFERLKRFRMVMFLTLLTLFVSGFLFFMPLTYGLPLSEHQYSLRLWLKGW